MTASQSSEIPSGKDLSSEDLSTALATGVSFAALIWLLWAYRVQAGELRVNVKALELQWTEMRKSAEALESQSKQSEEMARAIRAQYELLRDQHDLALNPIFTELKIVNYEGDHVCVSLRNAGATVFDLVILDQTLPDGRSFGPVCQVFASGAAIELRARRVQAIESGPFLWAMQWNRQDGKRQVGMLMSHPEIGLVFKSELYWNQLIESGIFPAFMPDLDLFPPPKP